MRRNVNILILLICIGSFGFSKNRQSGDQNVVAVIDIFGQDISSNEAAVFTELLRDELISLDKYKIIEKQRIDEVLAEIGFQQQGFTKEGAIALGQILNVHRIYTGTLGEIDDIRFLTIRIIDIETGQILRSATEKGFSAAYAQEAVERIVFRLHDLQLPDGIETPWEENPNAATRYYMIYSGWSIGTILNFHAESAFQSGPAGSGIPIWKGEAAEVETNPAFPEVGIKIGAWKKKMGGDLEISYISHTTPKQDIFYDISGYVYLPEINDFYAISLDTMPIPDKFLRYSSLGFNGNFYFHIPAKSIQPYVGFGGSLLMNRVKSDYPGPGNYGLEIEGEPLNTTSLGWGLQLPIGVKIPISNTHIVYVEFRAARNYFNYVSGDGFQEEKDSFVLQSFQFILGFGRIYR